MHQTFVVYQVFEIPIVKDSRGGRVEWAEIVVSSVTWAVGFQGTYK